MVCAWHAGKGQSDDELSGDSNMQRSLKESCQGVKAQAQDAADAAKINVGVHK
ncbi:hypothetical protein SAY87_014118 [Trapa incisa]|uniref:Uncharacterized protein n=1 Tax=Trapa incisa TaxID=236973 RepID=A0AAN7JK99_9MYRT|nr:hypothetical protein SAY87_014118 [Trapa incisa]